MTFRDKIKSILHHSGHKKSASQSSSASPTSPTTATAPTVAKPDPNKPPNARDPGFRKSFNLSEPQTTNGPAKTEPQAISSTSPKGVTVNGNHRTHMHTLDKYGDDYLAVSPRTNVTLLEESPANKGLASCPPLDADAKTALGLNREHKPKDPVVGAANVLNGLPSPQQDPNFGREQFANGERKADSGFLEPVPTRDTTVSQNTKPEHPSAFDLESSPPTSLAPENQNLTAANPKHTAPKVVRRSFGESSAAGEISPSILPSDETVSWSNDLIANIDQIKGVTAGLEPKQVANGIPNGINGDATPDTAPLSNLGGSADIQAAAFADIVTAQPLQPANKASNDLSVDQQAAAFADIIIAHVGSVALRNREPESEGTNTKLPSPLPSLKPIVTTTNTVPHADAEHMGDNIPDVLVIEGKSPIVTTTNTVPHAKVLQMGSEGGVDGSTKLNLNESIYTNRNQTGDGSVKEKSMGDTDSVYAVTRDMPGAF